MASIDVQVLRSIRSCSLLCLTLTLASADCLRIEELKELYSKKIPEAEIIKVIKGSKTAFRMGTYEVAELVRLGASDKALMEIESNRCGVVPVDLTFWHPYGGAPVIRISQGRLVINSSSGDFPGYSTDAVIQVGNKRTLIVEVGNAGNSDFKLHGRMLKVWGGPNKAAFKCREKSKVSSGDPDFIKKADGKFEYPIPNEWVTNGELPNLGFNLAPGQYNELKIAISLSD